jgi:hypothetical protein
VFELNTFTGGKFYGNRFVLIVEIIHIDPVVRLGLGTGEFIQEFSDCSLSSRSLNPRHINIESFLLDVETEVQGFLRPFLADNLIRGFQFVRAEALHFLCIVYVTIFFNRQWFDHLSSPFFPYGWLEYLHSEKGIPSPAGRPCICPGGHRQGASVNST